jgi:hypothetical protein
MFRNNWVRRVFWCLRSSGCTVYPVFSVPPCGKYPVISKAMIFLISFGMAAVSEENYTPL